MRLKKVFFSRIILLLSIVATGFISIIGSGASFQSFKDNLNVYHQAVEDKIVDGKVPIMFVWTVEGKVFFGSCDFSYLDDEYKTGLSKAGIMRVHLAYLLSDFHLYKQKALDTTYSDIDQNAQYIKLQRIMVEAEKNPHTYESFYRLQSLLLQRVKDLGGDAVIDICVYDKNFKRKKNNYWSSNYIKNWDSKIVMTATVIRFNNNFIPNEKFLLKKACSTVDVKTSSLDRGEKIK